MTGLIQQFLANHFYFGFQRSCWFPEDVERQYLLNLEDLLEYSCLEIIKVVARVELRLVTIGQSCYFRGGQARLNSRLYSCKCRCPWSERDHQAKTSFLEACSWLFEIFYVAYSQRSTPLMNFKANLFGLFGHSFYVDLPHESTNFDLRWPNCELVEIDQERLTVELKWCGSSESLPLVIPHFCWQILLSTHYSNQDHHLIYLRHNFFDPPFLWLINLHLLFDLAYSNGQFCLV